MGKLDATPQNATAVMADIAALDEGSEVVNGPEDRLNWDAINWRAQEKQVQRLRQRIFTATQAGDHKRVRNLQKLMLRSRANTLLSVRRVSEHNAGRHTPGVDRQVALTSLDRAGLAMLLHRRIGADHALPVRRVYIPKKGGKRPLGISVITDRAQQQRVRNALEPEWEARLDPKQYGFRPGRGCHDAIEMIHRALAARNAKREWVLDADLTSAFDRIDHNFLLDTAAALLAGAERPVLWLGGGAAGAREELVRLAHRLGAAVLTSNSGRAIIPEDDELVIGNFASTPGVAPLLADADLMLSVGTHFRSNETRSYHLALPKRHVQIDVDPAAVGRVYPAEVGRVYPAEVGLVGDAAPVLRDVLARLPEGGPDPDWSSRVTAVRAQVRADLFSAIGGYAEICQGLRAVLPRESVVARDVTIPSSQWGNRLLEFYERGTNVFPLGGGIGQGLAMGIGAAVGRPDTPTVVIAGDGGLSVHLGELASLAGTRAWCVVLVFNDGGYGVLRNMQEANGFDVTAVDLHTPDFRLLAGSMDMPYWLIQGAGGFETALREAVAAHRPVLIEVDVTAIDPRPSTFTPPVHIPTPTGGA